MTDLNNLGYPNYTYPLDFTAQDNVGNMNSNAFAEVFWGKVADTNVPEDEVKVAFEGVGWEEGLAVLNMSGVESQKLREGRVADALSKSFAKYQAKMRNDIRLLNSQLRKAKANFAKMDKWLEYGNGTGDYWRACSLARIELPTGSPSVNEYNRLADSGYFNRTDDEWDALYEEFKAKKKDK